MSKLTLFMMIEPSQGRCTKESSSQDQTLRLERKARTWAGTCHQRTAVESRQEESVHL